MEANSRATIVDNTDVDLDAMSVEKFLDYESFYPDGFRIQKKGGGGFRYSLTPKFCHSIHI